MAKIEKVNSFLELKQRSNRDIRQLGPAVSQYYEAESTASQSVINLNFSVEQTDEIKKQVLLFVDGKLLREGSGNDYQYSSITSGQSSQITLSVPLSAGLNIVCYKVGVAIESFPSPSTVQASVNTVKSDLNSHENANGFINGSFDYWQRGTTFTSIATSTYSADRWRYVKSGTTVVHDIVRSTDVPTNAFGVYSLRINCTTADAAAAAADIAAFDQLIEGNFFRRFKNKNIVLKFWIKATKTGTSCLTFQNSAATRSLVKEFTINQSNTWEQKTVRFSHDSTGAWFYDTNIGARIRFALIAGVNSHTTPDAWQSGQFFATSNQVNHCDSTSNIFQLADVHFCLDNSEANKDPEFQLAGRNLLEELQLCRRYYEKSYEIDVDPATSTYTGIVAFTRKNDTEQFWSSTLPFAAQKRIAPTISYWDAVGNASKITQANVTSALAATATDNVTPTSASFSGTGTAYLVWRLTNAANAGGLYFHFVASCEL